MKTIIVFIATFSLLITSAFASIIMDTTGLTTAHTTITFSEIVIPQGSAVDNHYTPFGAYFAPNTVFYNPQPGFFPTDPSLGNFSFSGTQSQLTSIFFTPFVNGAAFNLVTNPGETTFSALFNGNLIESFEAQTGTSDPDMFYGFTDFYFNEIQFLAPGNNAGLIDNLQISTTAPVPEPGTMMLLGVGIAGLAIWRRRKSA